MIKLDHENKLQRKRWVVILDILFLRLVVQTLGSPHRQLVFSKLPIGLYVGIQKLEGVGNFKSCHFDKIVYSGCFIPSFLGFKAHIEKKQRIK